MRVETTESLTESVGFYVNEAKGNDKLKNDLIKQYMPFIVKCVSDLIPGYVVVGDQDELSIGLLAFCESIDRYDSLKGPFLPYARLIIKSRITTFLMQNKKELICVPLEWAENLTLEPNIDSTSNLTEQIEIWKSDLSQFNISFQKLVVNKPKHKDTRDRAFEIAELASENPVITLHMYSKYRLPIQLIHKHLNFSVKVIDKSKVFITAIIIVFVKKLGAIKQWIK